MKTYYRFLVILFLLILPGAYAEEELLVVTDVSHECITAKLPSAADDSYKIGELYDVFETKESGALGGKFLHFVDNVYLKSIRENTLVFEYIWEGEDKNIKPGFTLGPTGRFYLVDENEIVLIADSTKKKTASPRPQNSELKILIFTGLIKKVISPSASLTPFDFSLENMRLDLGFALYFARSYAVKILFEEDMYFQLPMAFAFFDYCMFIPIADVSLDVFVGLGLGMPFYTASGIIPEIEMGIGFTFDKIKIALESRTPSFMLIYSSSGDPELFTLCLTVGFYL